MAKAILISSVTPVMAINENNPHGIPISVFDEIRLNTATNRAQYFKDFPTAFFGYNLERAKVYKGIKNNWWRQAMMGGYKSII